MAYKLIAPPEFFSIRNLPAVCYLTGRTDGVKVRTLKLQRLAGWLLLVAMVFQVISCVLLQGFAFIVLIAIGLALYGLTQRRKIQIPATGRHTALMVTELVLNLSMPLVPAVLLLVAAFVFRFEGPTGSGIGSAALVLLVVLLFLNFVWAAGIHLVVPRAKLRSDGMVEMSFPNRYADIYQQFQQALIAFQKSGGDREAKADPVEEAWTEPVKGDWDEAGPKG